MGAGLTKVIRFVILPKDPMKVAGQGTLPGRNCLSPMPLTSNLKPLKRHDWKCSLATSCLLREIPVSKLTLQ